MPVEKRSDESDHLKRPIILIGTGRSGSTLLVRMLNAHPNIQFEGETDFLIARLWREVWGNQFWLKSQYGMRHKPRDVTCSRAGAGELPPETLDGARERAARGLRTLFAEILRIDPDSAAWGFKEIWNGNDAVAQVPWNIYDTIFPDARRVHLVRHPFAFAQSSARWNQRLLTSKVLGEELLHWQQVVAWSRQLNNRECFYGVRFEDLVERPQDCLEPILISAGLAWHEDCARELNQRFMASHQWAPCAPSRTLKQAQTEQMIDATPGLAPLMDELGYTAPRQFEVKQENDTNVWLAKKVRKAVKRYVRAHRR